MKAATFLILSSLLVGLAGCATTSGAPTTGAPTIAGARTTGGARTPPTSSQRLAVFNEAEYAAYESTGTASIAGQAFAKTKSGEVKYAAGNIVTLNPVTAYSTEWWEREVNGTETLAPPDERAHKHNRQRTADGEGRFHFDKLPAGEYYVVASVAWQYGRYDWDRAEAALGSRVQVANGERVDVILPVLKRRNGAFSKWQPGP